jgi:molybdopterin converting factor small subunit|tara:strand:+ start:161 stop:379 length:219 start_codon:yes stop_codon:yes gene_type:complete
MSDLEFEARQEQVREDMLDEIYNQMGVLYEGHDMEDIVQNVMNYVNKNYDDWDKYIQQGDIVELVQEYASHI